MRLGPLPIGDGCAVLDLRLVHSLWPGAWMRWRATPTPGTSPWGRPTATCLGGAPSQPLSNKKQRRTGAPAGSAAPAALATAAIGNHWPTLLRFRATSLYASFWSGVRAAWLHRTAVGSAAAGQRVRVLPDRDW